MRSGNKKVTFLCVDGKLMDHSYIRDERRSVWNVWPSLTQFCSFFLVNALMAMIHMPPPVKMCLSESD